MASRGLAFLGTLLIVRAFADQMGGTLRVTSDVGKGTSAVLELPARTLAVPARGSVEVETAAPWADPARMVLADLHALDPEAVGLGDFGKANGYLERQVRRWGSQWDLVRLQDDPRDADVRRLHGLLTEKLPL